MMTIGGRRLQGAHFYHIVPDEVRDLVPDLCLSLWPKVCDADGNLRGQVVVVQTGLKGAEIQTYAQLQNISMGSVVDLRGQQPSFSVNPYTLSSGEMHWDAVMGLGLPEAQDLEWVPDPEEWDGDILVVE